MKVVGFDPASSFAGIALAEGGELTMVDAWVAPKKVSKDDALLNWFSRIGLVLDTYKPDLVGFAQSFMSRNMKTVRIISYWESAVIIQARKRRIIVQPMSDKSARTVVYGDGKIEKADVLVELKKRYPQLSWLPTNRGGLDQADAGTVALATPDLLERR